MYLNLGPGGPAVVFLATGASHTHDAIHGSCGSLFMFVYNVLHYLYDFLVNVTWGMGTVFVGPRS